MSETQIEITQPVINITLPESVNIQLSTNESQPLNINIPVSNVNLCVSNSQDMNIDLPCCIPGPPGPAGADGPAGVGVPAGGNTGQVLKKASNTDYDTEWAADGGGGGGGTIESDTYANWETKRASGELTPGAQIFVSDRCDLGMFLQCGSTNEICISGNGGFLNCDFQADGEYSGVEAVTGVPFVAQKGIWRTSFEAITIAYTDVSPSFFNYSVSSGVFTDGETFTTDLGNTGVIIHDDGAGTVTVSNVAEALVAGEIITGDISGETATVDTYTNLGFAVGDTITGATTNATLFVTQVNGPELTGYITSSGVAFDGSEVLDNGNGTTANMDGLATDPEIVQGDVVIWDLKHYQLVDITLINGTNPVDNLDAYTLLERTAENVGYIPEWDIIEFDWNNDWIQYRADTRGNSVGYSKKIEEIFALGFTGINVFQFGFNRVRGNLVINGLINLPNNLGVIANNTIYPGGSIKDCVTDFTTNIILNSIYNRVEISNCIFGENVYVSSNIFENQVQFIYNTFEANTTFENNKMAANAQIKYCNFGENSYISENTFFQSVEVDQIQTGIDFELKENILENGCQIKNLTFGDTCTFSNNNFGAGVTYRDHLIPDGQPINRNFIKSAVDIIGVSYTGKSLIFGFSTLDIEVDITGAGALDFSGLPVDYIGIFKITSANSTETISADSLPNFPTNFPFKIVPASGLELTITCTPAASATNGSIVGSTSTIVLDGTNGDFVELESDTSGTFVKVKNIQQYA